MQNWVFLLNLLSLIFVAVAISVPTNSVGADDGDYDIIIVGCGVGGHGAALHAVSKGLRTAVVSSPGDIGGTCVNRGCVPSKALLAAAHKVHSLKNDAELKKFGITVEGQVTYDRRTIADHATGLATTLRTSLEASLKKHGIDVFHAEGKVLAPHQVQAGNRVLTGKLGVVLSPGSVPAVPPGIIVDEKTVFTSDSAVRLESVPQWLMIVGGGYIGLEFAEIYSSLGAEVTIVDALDRILPTFDADIAAAADRLIIKPRGIEFVPNVIAKEIIPGELGGRPTTVRLANAKSGQLVSTYVPDSVMIATGRRSNAKTLGLEKLDVELKKNDFVPVDDHMRVLDRSGVPVQSLFCIGDANGIMMLAHAASAQGVAVVENILGRWEVITDHRAIPAAAFTHPEIASVGLSEDQAKAEGLKRGFEVGKATAQFRANTKSLAELQSGGMAKLFWRKDTGAIIGAQMIGLHASDLMQQIANAVASRQSVGSLAMTVHTHPTLSEVPLELYKQAAGLFAH